MTAGHAEAVAAAAPVPAPVVVVAVQLPAVSCLCVLPLLLLLLLLFLFLFGCLWSPLALGFHLQLNYARNFTRNLFSFALLSSSLARVSGPHGHLGAVGPTLPGGGRARLQGERGGGGGAL